jgi:O-antigen ligase
VSTGSTIGMGGYGLKSTRNLLLAAIVATFALGVGLAVGIGTDKLVYLGILVAIPLALKWPLEVALGSIALVVPFDSILVAVRSGSGTTTVSWFVGLAAGVLLLARIISGVRKAPPFAAKIWSALIVWGTLTVLWAIDTNVATRRLSMSWSLLILYLAAVSSRVNKKQLRVILTFAVIGGLAAAIWASWAYFSGISWSNTGRASLSLDSNDADPNFFAAMLLVPLSLAIGMFRTSRGLLMKTLTALTVAMAALAIFLTMSRGALVALALLGLVYTYRLGMKLRTFAGIVVVLGVLAMFAPPIFWQRLKPDTLSTGAGRTNVWAAGSQMLRHHFIFGVGFSNFPVAYDTYAGAGPKFQGYRRDSHNTYLNVLSEQGAIGLILFFIALRYQFRLLRPDPTRSRDQMILVVSCEAALVAVLGAAFFLDLLFTKFVWLLLMVSTLVARSEPDREIRTTSNARLEPKASTSEKELNTPIFTG